MPTPQQFGRSDIMGRGPYEKSGIIEDTCLPPGKEVEERFDIFFPTDDVKNAAGKMVRETLEREMDVTVELWYLPFGNKRTSAQLWKEWEETITIKSDGLGSPR
ncbi:hypothetical protein HTZ97_16730 [Desulfuromonas acetoxidans]|uniref:Uncharacterized protein n=3 Tax=Desulfuromonas acetoxidans TaxID=891 RepID=Q1JWF8_DESA6|nr:conserved hypothetical protein [Desulfuromonas acetoxidans DSM 684]EAT16495.1 conserved hypothetical protein [Desulfuromonas acetoxidans DSM 684]MBF0647180.1 hypothetical protein [Desulfuromonas acetoxidans]NVD26261.1 hypothetical protein [Desulfuromonas acetoxidans]NVE18103.1 hypothetical protein [Desulfuromonas acetoxidans]